MFPARLRSFARLAADERRLALRALGWLVVARVGLKLLAFTRVHALMEGSRATSPRKNSDWPAKVRRAVLRASRSLPGTTCLAQSLAAERLLRAEGLDARLSIGVADGPGGGAARARLDAHAWVESGGVLVTGDDPLDRYQLLATFGSG